MAVRPPSDAIVALRGMGRRWRGLFAGLGEDESPEALAQRAGASGRSALDHAVHATRTIELLHDALRQIMIDDDAVLSRAVLDPDARGWPVGSAGVDATIDDLARAAEAMADEAERVAAGDWTRGAAVERRGHRSALDVLWDAVDGAVADLKAAEVTLREVRGRA
jgi:hypothetical protein